MVGTSVIRATDELVEISALAGRGPVTRTALETLLDPDAVDGHEKIAVALTDLLQTDMEVRINVDDLPADEELLGFTARQMQDRFGDGMRFDREGSDLFLVAREDTITVTWDGSSYVVEIRSAR